MKRAVIINGIADKVKNIHFLGKAMSTMGYETELIDILETKQKLGKIILKSKPEVIIGFSLGGLVAIELAEIYPKAKLILIATGCRAEPGGVWLRWLKRACREKWGVKLAYQGVRLIPIKLLTEAYRRVNPAPKKGQLEKDYERDMRSNVEYFRKIPFEKWQEVAKYMNETDNSEICRRLWNRTLVIAGSKDKVISLELGRELCKLIKNSRLVITEGAHFNTIEE